MEASTIAIYCFIDDLCKKIETKEKHHNSKLTDSQAITILIISGLYFQGNHKAACTYMQDFMGFNMPDKSNFNRKAHQLIDKMEHIFVLLTLISKELNLESIYIIDSFPLPVCENVRATRAKLFNGEEYCGYNASKKTSFYGLKVHMICNKNGLPIEFRVTAGSVHDSITLQNMDIDLAPNSYLYADKAYINQQFKQDLLDFQQIKLKCPSKKNMLVQNDMWERVGIQHERKHIEITFASLKRLFPHRIHAVTSQGFLMKVFLFVIAFSLSILLLK